MRPYRPASFLRRLVWRSISVSVLALFALASRFARAHGAAPTVVDVLEWESEAPTLVRLSRGLARPDGEAWRYICPTRWGGPESPLVGSAGGLTVVAGLRGLMEVGSDGLTTALAVSPPFDSVTARSIASEGDSADGDVIIGLTTKGGLLSLAPGAPTLLLSLQPPPDAVVFESASRVLVASEVDGTLSIYRVRLGTGTAIRDPDLVTVPYDGTPIFVKAGGADGATFWIRSATQDGYRLDRLAGLGDPISRAGDGSGGSEAAPRAEQVTLTPVTTSADPIHGPVNISASSPAGLGDDSGTYVVISGQPHRLTSDELEPLAKTERFSCLRSHPALGLLACILPDLKRYSPTSGLGETVVALAELRPPSLAGLDDTDTQSCKYDWLDVAVDGGFPADLLLPAEWNDSVPDEDPRSDVAGSGAGPAVAASGDCQSAYGRRNTLPLALFMTLVALTIARRRRNT